VSSATSARVASSAARFARKLASRLLQWQINDCLAGPCKPSIQRAGTWSAPMVAISAPSSAPYAQRARHSMAKTCRLDGPRTACPTDRARRALIGATNQEREGAVSRRVNESDEPGKAIRRTDATNSSMRSGTRRALMGQHIEVDGADGVCAESNATSSTAGPSGAIRARGGR